MIIAVQLNQNNQINNVNLTDEDTASRQSKVAGWLLVNADSYFSISNRDQWTVRKSDNKLVHISTDMTPDEESQQNFTTLTMQNLATSKSVKEVQSGLTSLTQAQLQDVQDKADIKNGLTEVTKQLAAMQLKLATLNTTKTTEAE
ncbi:hypothetical protein [Companilactobacillus muriivasis]|uniref:hypothetical protein n=1 Tax=Companilactobacillus muriivasis TaxID=3081444 RepID=UPI0030C76286